MPATGASATRGRTSVRPKAIAAKAAESEAAIGEIRDSAIKNITEVATDTAKELVLALGGTADATTISAAVNARMKG